MLLPSFLAEHSEGERSGSQRGVVHITEQAPALTTHNKSCSQPAKVKGQQLRETHGSVFHMWRRIYDKLHRFETN